MKNQEGYNAWASTYDTVVNKTRDLESEVLRKTLANLKVNHILEAGCGTGKNTTWLAEHTRILTAVDFSDEMIKKAKEKTTSSNITFRQMDLMQEWPSLSEPVELVTASLVLEHIENLDFVFAQAKTVTSDHGLFYVCELHPFKQYLGSKARFELEGKVVELECFIHHITDYIKSAQRNGFNCIKIEEWFDGKDQHEVPRLVSFMFSKK